MNIYPKCDTQRWESQCSSYLVDADNYYTKDVIDQKIEEIESAITSGCCITPEEVDDKISSYTYSKEVIDEKIPSLSGYATEQWVLDKHYITGIDLSDYATKEYLSAYTYDKETIDSKIISGGTFDPTQYYTTANTYNKTEINNFLETKLDASAYTPCDLSNYYTKNETSSSTQITDALNLKQDTLSAGTNITISGNVISASVSGGGCNTVELTQAEYDILVQTGQVDPDTYYIITDAQPVDLSQYWTSAQTESAITSSVTNVYNSLSSHTANTTVHVTQENKNYWNGKANIWCGTEQQWSQISGSTSANTIYLIY